MKTHPIIPVIMSGGAGSRLWPLSRQAMPKQLLPLVTEKTMAQETACRFGVDMFAPPVFVCNAAHAAPIKAQMKMINRPVGGIITEPVGRNTAPCAVVAALFAKQTRPGALVLLAPADHHVTNPEAFHTAISKAVTAAHDGYLVTFGITPDKPETGYGYIERKQSMGDDVYGVNAFYEKPDAATAQGYVDAGTFSWNAGLFLFDPDAFLTEINSLAPEIYKKAKASFEAAAFDHEICALDPVNFAACPSESIDYAVMEKTKKAALVPVDMGWNDIGSFEALKLALAPGTDENVKRGDIITHNTTGCLIQSDGPKIATVGVSGLTIIAHEGQILVASLNASQDVKKIVEALKANGELKAL